MIFIQKYLNMGCSDGRGAGTSHPACEKCGGVMYPMSERYDLDFPGFTDMWYECINCGNTVSR